ncbi:hypothetical protein [Metaclostridioides mangenotii]|uniref:hypothetical protein n=1 Tax=Metaclostridioides mangenotii TaxID=1540 RepID=UPI0004BB8E7B|nr:hypothetical protein [Clostridioides mangenotii]
MKEINYKKYIFLGLFGLIICGMVFLDSSFLSKTKTQISDLSTTEYNWYFNPREDGKQPTPIKEAEFLRNTTHIT